MEPFLKIVTAACMILISQTSHRVGWPAVVYGAVVAGFAVYAGMPPVNIAITTLVATCYVQCVARRSIGDKGEYIS